MPPRGALRAVIVVGPTVIREDTLQQTAYQVGLPGAFPVVLGSYGPESSLTRWTVGATTGVDLGFQLRRHLQLVPQVRIHVVLRDNDPGNGSLTAFLGLSGVIVRPAVGVRAIW